MTQRVAEAVAKKKTIEQIVEFVGIEPTFNTLRQEDKELLPRLDLNEFWQVHRGTVVRAEAIESVTRDEAGKLLLALRGRSEKLPVSRLYAHLFKAM